MGHHGGKTLCGLRGVGVRLFLALRVTARLRSLRLMRTFTFLEHQQRQCLDHAVLKSLISLLHHVRCEYMVIMVFI